MPRYERAVASNGAPGAGVTYFDIRTSSAVQARVREIIFTIGGTSNTEIGLIYSATVGTASTQVTGVAADRVAAASATQIGTAWSAAPTISGTPYERSQYIGGTVGNGFDWVWSADAPLLIPVSKSILLWNRGAAQGSVAYCTIVWDE